MGTRAADTATVSKRPTILYSLAGEREPWGVAEMTMSGANIDCESEKRKARQNRLDRKMCASRKDGGGHFVGK